MKAAVTAMWDRSNTNLNTTQLSYGKRTVAAAKARNYELGPNLFVILSI